MEQHEIVHTSSTPLPTPAPMPVDENTRTCRSCGSEEKVVRRSFKRGFGMVAFLDCGHFQNDDEY
jgi:hypothetical protein